MEVKRIEYVGEICDTLTHSLCHSGITDAGICSIHKGLECIVLRMWVDKHHFTHPIKGLLPPGNYKVIIEKVE